jgi:alanine racemase
MTRSGALDEFPELVSTIGELIDEERLMLVGTWSHLACADEPTHPLNEEQCGRFLAALDYMASEGINPGIRHLANSGAVTHFPDFHFDMVRAGLLLYGYFPGGIVSNQISIKPAMELSADIALVKRVSAGASVGYGATVELATERFIALIPMGYADGIPRNFKMPIEVSIAGRRYPIIGRVSMDQVSVDLGPETNVKAGDRAIFFGGEGASSADDWARAAGTISYEILSRIGGRVPRFARISNP